MAAAQLRLFCPTCTYPNDFATTEGLETHLALVHFKCTPFTCEKCRGEAKFHNEARLRRHYAEDHGMERFEVGRLSAPSPQLTHSSPLSQISHQLTDEE